MFENTTIQCLLQAFCIGEPFHYEVIRFSKDKDKDILITCTTTNYKLLIRFYRDPFTTLEGLQIQGEFCHALIENDIPVPRRFKTNDSRYYLPAHSFEIPFPITVEEWMPGREVADEEINKSLLHTLGSVLGKTHAISEKHHIHFDYGTYWGMFGGNTSDAPGVYDDIELESNLLKDSLKDAEIDQTLVDEVFTLFYKKRKELQMVWNDLPKGAVQGDFSPNNILLDDSDVFESLIDFNIAGDEVFINHLAGEGIFLAYELMGDDKDDCFYEFLSAYMEERPLSRLEIKTLPLIIQVVRPFRFRRTQKIIKLVREKQFTEVERQLSIMFNLLHYEKEGGI
ncbi:phosphotransferase enzyme family protein [Bacillus paramycoides]|uniref:phosphotransferase enzyme family protein n=1 Tax=Bacillus paramycoides TaxID=2026194 RepID=UPI003CFD1BD2